VVACEHPCANLGMVTPVAAPWVAHPCWLWLSFCPWCLVWHVVCDIRLCCLAVALTLVLVLAFVVGKCHWPGVCHWSFGCVVGFVIWFQCLAVACITWLWHELFSCGFGCWAVALVVGCGVRLCRWHVSMAVALGCCVWLWC